MVRYLEMTLTNENCMRDKQRFVGKPEGKRILGRTLRRCKGITMHLKGIG
jgi:hypothetical protein